MKPSKSRSQLVIWMMALCASVLISIPAFANDPLPSNITSKYQKENAEIRNDIANIKLHQNEVKLAKDKLRDDIRNGRKAEAINDQRELAKAKADLRRAEDYLKADKKDLVQDHKLAICIAKHTIKKDQAAFGELDRKLAKDIALGNKKAIARDRDAIAAQEKKLQKDLANLEGEKEGLDYDLVAINTQLGKPRAVFFNIGNSETSYAVVE